MLVLFPGPETSAAPSEGSGVAVVGTSVRNRYQRTYQACLNCRKRKVKCVLMDDGSELTPTCVKCQRERRVCVFTRQRRTHHSPQSYAENPETSRTVRTVYDPSDDAVRSRAPRRESQNEVDKATLPGNERQEQRHTTNHDEWQECLIEGVIQSSITNQRDALNLLYTAIEHSDSDPATMDSVRLTEEWCTVRYQLSKPQPQVLQAWSKCPFVMHRWVTPMEAVTWVDLFFQNMAILSPVMDDFYQPHENHHKLINEEPVLCSTILMVSCRYHHLTGDGSLSRGFLLHERLWKYCQTLFNQIWWGGERRTRPHIRTVGAIQSLFLLAEWHPRPFHMTFDTCLWALTPEHPTGVGQIPSSWHEGLSEPVRKSNRMSWMLVSSALALAHEIGLFNERSSESAPSRQPEFVERYERLKRLFFVFINNVTSRLGCQTPKTPLFHTLILSVLDYTKWTDNAVWSDWMGSWIDLTRIVRSSSEILFPNEVLTKDLLQNGRYCDLLGHFNHVLDQWLEKYPRIPGPSVRYDILFIEYQYVRIYINSLAMQAIAMRRRTKVNSLSLEHYDIYPQDHHFVHQVLDACTTVLEMVMKHSRLGYLKFLPVRVHIQIASAAVYLIKALALGIQAQELNDKFLDLLQQTAHKLRSDTVDDIYLSIRFASLLDIHVQVLRRRFNRPSDPVGSNTQVLPSALMQVGEPLENDTAYYDQFIFSDDWLAPQCDAPFQAFFDGVAGHNLFNFQADNFGNVM
ncbi:Fungal Zn2-Cys6 binuclear cluster domain-containing protein [Cladophialophora immunda]|nr:Fungal Zn2-Cys6 binuclear cluster domain-containing protein [Cladophialophora immunda]